MQQRNRKYGRNCSICIYNILARPIRTAIALLFVLAYFSCCWTSTSVVTMLTNAEVVIHVLLKNKIKTEMSSGGSINRVDFDEEFQQTSPANVSSGDVYNMSSINFVIQELSANGTLTTKIDTFHLSSKQYRKLNQNGRRNETIWHGSLLPQLVPSTAASFQRIDRNSSQNTRQRKKKRYRTGFCTIYASSGLIRSAIFTNEKTVHDLVYLNHLSRHEIRTTRWQDFPPEDEPVHNGTNSEEIVDVNGEITERLQYDISNIASSLEYISVSPLRTPWSTESGPGALMVQESSSSIFKRHQSSSAYNNNNSIVESAINNVISKSTTPMITVDVLVVVTNRGMCEFARVGATSCPTTATNRAPMEARIKVVESITNTAMSLANAQIRVVKIVFLSEGTWDPISDSDSINEMSRQSDILKLRDATGSDLVAVIAGKGGNCGVAVRGGFRSITSQACLAQHTFSHEVGHNFGCNHNREVVTNQDHQYAYGYRSGTSYRTFLSYNCEKNCPRLPYFSSVSLLLPDGRPLGNATNDNIRMIAQSATTVSNWRAQVISPSPTSIPTKSPTRKPTGKPSRSPTRRPTRRPTRAPTRKPTHIPTRAPTRKPTNTPTFIPTLNPTNSPTSSPTKQPVTESPTKSAAPSNQPSVSPSPTVTRSPSSQPSFDPSYQPTFQPTFQPTSQPTFQPTKYPTSNPSISPISARPQSTAPAPAAPRVKLTCSKTQCSNGTANSMHRYSIFTGRCIYGCIAESNVFISSFFLGFKCGPC
jgi:Metallo-peptidase family M12B Reprolysin-like/PT repeat